MKRVVRITESDIHKMVDKTIQDLLKENENDQFNVKNVFHVSNKSFEEFKKTNFDYFFFSDKPISLNGNVYTYLCNLSLHKPLIFTDGNSWGYPLWLFLSDRDGMLIPEEEFTPEKYDGYLGCPYEFWKVVYYDEEEYNIDEIPSIVKQLNLGYDGVIIKNIQEGDSAIFVDDYVVFEPNQIQIVRRY